MWHGAGARGPSVLLFHLLFFISLPQCRGVTSSTAASYAVFSSVLLLPHALDASFALIWEGGDNSCDSFTYIVPVASPLVNPPKFSEFL